MSPQQYDLAHALSRLLGVALAAEEPVLAAHDLQMWDYAVLSALEHGPVGAQAELAALVRRDKTRLIPILDRLEAAGLLRRSVDPADRRNRVVELTASGRQRVTACRADIRAGERRLLAALPPEDATVFVRVLDRLAGDLPDPAPASG
jgi:DNA-binding MarR family transcriptional regulator